MKIYKIVNLFEANYFYINLINIALALASFMTVIFCCTFSFKQSGTQTEINDNNRFTINLENFIKEFGMNVENPSENKNDTNAFYEEDCDQLGQCVKKIVLQRYCCEIDVNGTANGDCCNSMPAYKKT
jgi:hypothetical protein